MKSMIQHMSCSMIDVYKRQLEFPVDVMEFIFVLAIVLLKVFFINLV